MPRRKKQSSEAAVRDLRRKTRRRFSAEEKIRIVLDGLRGEVSVAELCRREGIAGFFIKIREAGDDVGIPEILSDHPDTGSRVSAIQGEAKRLGCSTKPADPSRWKAFQQSLPENAPANGDTTD
jgi:hypothetical protein